MMRSLRSARDCPVLSVRRLFLLAAIAAGAWLVTRSKLRADTIFLKNGNQIPDCQVTRETDKIIYVRTPVGDMGVPRDQIHRIQRTKTVFDRYKEQLAELRPDDSKGLFKLALWCQRMSGLRKEFESLLAKVIELNPNHLQARRLLGHMRVGKEWIVPEPLAISVKIGGASAKELHERLEMFLKDRKDVRLEAEPVKASTKASEDLNECLVAVSVIISRKAGTRFYGQTVGRASLGASIRFETRNKWVGKKLKTSADGSVPASSGNAGLAIKNALGRNDRTLHMFFDELIQIRAKKLEAQLAREGKEKKEESSSQGKSSGASSRRSS